MYGPMKMVLSSLQQKHNVFTSFCQQRKRHDDPVLTVNGSAIPVVDQAKFLGVIFDKKLSFVPHIKALRTKCLKALNLLKVLAHTDWGADRKVLLRLYRSLRTLSPGSG